MADRALVDTNILLRAFHNQFVQHPQAKALIERMWDEGVELWISRQVIREYLVQTTNPRTFDEPLTIEQAVTQAENFRVLFRVADDTDEVTTQLFKLIQQYPTRAKPIHDANLVATMLVNQIDTLLTLNTADLKRFQPIIKLITIESSPSA